jgi:hypothetical protein
MKLATGLCGSAEVNTESNISMTPYALIKDRNNFACHKIY